MSFDDLLVLHYPMREYGRHMRRIYTTMVGRVRNPIGVVATLLPSVKPNTASIQYKNVAGGGANPVWASAKAEMTCNQDEATQCRAHIEATGRVSLTGMKLST
jgi:hypothetical protein